MDRRTPKTETDWLRWLLFGVMVVAAAVRVGALLVSETMESYAHPMVDAYVYWQQTKDLLAGKDPFAEGLYQPPGYPYFLLVMGKMGLTSLMSVRLVQVVLGVATTWLVGLLGRTLGTQAGMPWAGVFAAAVYALYPSTVLFELDILTPALTGFCLAGALIVIWRDDLPSAWRAGVAGFLLGVACVVHPTFLLAAAVIWGWLFWLGRDRIAPAICFAVVLCAVLTPTTVRNAQQFGVLAPVSLNSGLNFYIGNNSDWRRTVFLRAGLPFRQLALEANPDQRNSAERNQWWRDQAMVEVRSAPLAWMSTLATKALWSVNNTEIPRNEDYRCLMQPGEPLRWLRALPVRYGLVFPLAVVGALVVWRRGGQGRLLVLLWMALHLPMVVFFVADRYRLATWPVVSVLSCVGFGTLVQQARAGLRPVQNWVVVSVAALVPWIPIDARTDLDPSVCTYAKAHVAVMEDRFDEAAALYQEVLAAHPEDMSAHYWLAKLSSRSGATSKALSHMRVVLGQFPDHFPSLKMAASLHRKAGDLSGGIELLRRAHAVPGDRRPTGAMVVQWLVEAGREDEAHAFVVAHPELKGHSKVKKALGKRHQDDTSSP